MELQFYLELIDLFSHNPGVYILQNIMVVGGGWLLRKKMKTEGVGGKKEGKREKGEKLNV